MEEEIPLLQQQLITVINESLQNHIYSNATFFAERLLAEKDDEESRNLLARCFMAENKHYKVFYLLQNCRKDENRYLLALACLKLNKSKEAQVALMMNAEFDLKNNNSVPNSSKKYSKVPNGSYGMFVLGQAFEKSKQITEAKDCYIQVLSANPSLWMAYEKLCKLGVNSKPESTFSEQNLAGFLESAKKIEKNSMVFSNNGSMEKMDKFERSQGNQMVSEEQGGNEISKIYRNLPNNSQNSRSPIANFGFLNTNSNPNVFTIDEGTNPKNFKELFNVTNIANVSKNPTTLNFQNFLNSQNIQSNQATTKVPKRGDSALIKKGIQSNNTPIKDLTYLNSNNFKDISTLLKKYGEAYSYLSIYLCTEAIELFLKLPHNHLKSGWVLINLGRCYMECTKYSEAEKYFSEAVKNEPWRLEGIEFYSSCLWQLKKQADLTVLAQSALEKSQLQAESWIALGNCFSLLKEHETALKFLQRALQLSPNSAYLYSLCGHEYAYLDDLPKAQKNFESAVNLDMRCYNAWFGLGNICSKKEKHDLAIENFRRAISINGRLSVLHTYLGRTLMIKKEFNEAFKSFTNAELLDPHSHSNKYEKCQALVHLGKYDEAIEGLDCLLRLIPKEGQIFLLMGKIYKKKGEKSKAHKFFNLALDLESKDNQRIKGMIENLNNESSSMSDEEV